VAGEEKERALGQQLLLGKGSALLLGQNQQADQIIARMRPARGYDRAEVLPHRYQRVVGAACHFDR
jgi:hypothetical protein